MNTVSVETTRSKIARFFNRRNLVISALLFLIIVIQLLVLMPRDIEVQDLRPAKVAKTIKGSKTGRANQLSKEIPSGQVVRNAQMVEAKQDQKEIELWADRAVRPKDREEWTLDDVRVKFYATNGVTYTVTGKNGGVTTSTYAMWIKGNVITKSSNGYTFRSESVFYDPKIKRLSSPAKIEMDGPPDANGSRLYLDGEDMVADLTTNQMNVNRKVRARRKVSAPKDSPGGDQKTAQIQSNSAVFSGKSNLALFKGNVIIDVDTMRLTGPEARFSYDPGIQNLDSMVVSGGVKVTDSDKSATSGSVSVYFKDDRYVFKGSPRVVQQQDELIGDEIVFLHGGKQVQVINARAQVDPTRADPSPADAKKGLLK
jgi:LPS export ABC transporter protein LptC/lipopolysaccharide transport protein LptA